MGGFFVFDKQTGIGFTLSDKEFKDAAGLLAVLVGIYAIYALIVVILGLVCAAPFALVFALDYFFTTIVENNTGFFIGTGLLLLLTRLFWGRGSQNRIIRILSFLYFFVFLLYLLLNILHLNAAVYTFFGLFKKYLPESAFAQLLTQEEINTQVNTNWFYGLYISIFDKFLSYINWIVTQILNIDHSAYSVALADINILLVLKTALLDIVVGGFALITTLAGSLVLLAILAIAIILPYLTAFYFTITINKGIYAFRSLHTCKFSIPSKELASDPTLQAAIKKSEIHTPSAQKEAAALYLQAAQNGNPYAQYLYADCLQSGKGIVPNKKEAFYWYQKAANQGEYKAMFQTAANYCCGNGTYVDRALARAWMITALKNKSFYNFVQTSPLLKETAVRVLTKCKYVKYF